MSRPNADQFGRGLILAGGVAVATLVLSIALPAQAYTLDFEDPDIHVGNGSKGSKVKDASGQNLKDKDGDQVWTGDGDLIYDQWAEQGVVIYEGSGRDLLLFNSNCNGNGSTQFARSCTGGDPDLATGDYFGTAAQGNVLIIQENSTLYNPDDNAKGGSIYFDFDDLVDLTQISLLDIEDGNPDLEEISFAAYFSDGSSQIYLPSDLSYTNLANRDGDNSMYQFDLSGIDAVEQFAVSYAGSGAIASISWDTSEEQDIPEPRTVLGLLAVGMISLSRLKKIQP